MKDIAEIIQELRQISPLTLLEPVARPERRPPRRILVEQSLSDRASASVYLDVDEVPPDDLKGDRNWIFQELDEIVGGKQDSAGQTAIDALAWYWSFRHQSTSWGIFIPASSLAYLEDRVFKELPGSRSDKWRLAFESLLQHEYVHFVIDYVCAQWELLLQASCRNAFHGRLKPAGEPYFRAEELLANAHMLRTMSSDDSSVSDLLKAFVKRQPPGYSDALTALSDDNFRIAFDEVIRAYVGLAAFERGLDWKPHSFEYFERMPSVAALAEICPVYLIPDHERIGMPYDALRLITQIPLSNLIETTSFKKDFQKLDDSLKRRWNKLKQQMDSSIPRAARFEKMKGLREEIFAVRLNDNFRVHLRHANDHWEAIAVNDHKAMGHG
ncbi:hypothetical protein BH10CYA1_BH10CYA1_59820 [soil metagenome]